MQNQTPPLELASNSKSTSQDSPSWQALDRWRPQDPSPLTRRELSTVISGLSEKIKPSTIPEYLRAMKDLITFATAFGIPCPDPETVQGIYREQLASLPGDLLQTAIARIRGEWVWGNRMPFPAEIREKISADLNKRMRLLSRARVAMLKARDPETKELASPERLAEAARLAKTPSPSTANATGSKPRRGYVARGRQHDEELQPDPELQRQWAEIREAEGIA